MAEDSTSVSGGKVSPLYRPWETIVFKYEGNVRATVEGYEVLDGKLRLRCRATLDFEVPASQIIEVEREGE